MIDFNRRNAMNSLNGKKVAILVANEGVEQIELTSPREALEDAGATVQLLAPEAGEVQAFNHLDKADTFAVDSAVGEASADDFDALVLPGGVANPDQLRGDAAAIEFIQLLAAANKPIGVICHGPWTLINAGLVHGREMTSWPSLELDITNAGGRWVDREVVIDNGVISSRNPDDLPAFNAAIVETFAGSGADAERAQSDRVAH
jgi:protease I